MRNFVWVLLCYSRHYDLDLHYFMFYFGLNALHLAILYRFMNQFLHLIFNYLSCRIMINGYKIWKWILIARLHLISYIFFCSPYSSYRLKQANMEGKRVIGWAARDPSGHLSPFSFTLRFHSLILLYILLILSQACNWLMFQFPHKIGK